MSRRMSYIVRLSLSRGGVPPVKDQYLSRGRAVLDKSQATRYPCESKANDAWLRFLGRHAFNNMVSAYIEPEE